jgi:hypothetical protein
MLPYYVMEVFRMRSITVSTDVFARIWSLRQLGEDTEDAILSRILGCIASHSGGSSASSRGTGLLDSRSGVLFPEGFEVFRTYLGVKHRARITSGRWVLESDGRTLQSLNELSRAIGAKTENAWLNWLYLDGRGMHHPVSKLRDPSMIATRSRQKEAAVQNYPVGGEASQAKGEYGAMLSDGTWRDDVRNALQRLGGRASLSRIYKEVEAIRSAAGRSTPPSLEATIRRTLEDHSSDSENYRGQDLFCMPEGKGAGVWGLR